VRSPPQVAVLGELRRWRTASKSTMPVATDTFKL
jgi:hypothetical protein